MKRRGSQKHVPWLGNLRKLRPTESIIEEVFLIVLNRQRTRIAICCKNDVFVIDFPPRSGRHGAFKGGVSDISCRCRRLFVQRGLVNIRRVHWYPEIDQDYYLAVLTSDNVIQMIDIRGPSFLDVWVLHSGPQNRIPSLDSIGEAAVDFHFIPPYSLKHISPAKSKKNSDEFTEWPALILHGNGDTVIIDLAIKGEGRKIGKTTSPLLMYPSAEDNYGVDCCEILIIDGPLPVVVIASSTGILYHCILLNHPASDYQNYNIKKSDSVSSVNSASDAIYVLHVIESVELDIGLNLGSNFDDTLDEIVSSPIKLIEDQTSDARYLAIHAAGVHSVNLPLIHELRIFFSKNYNTVDLPPESLLDFRRNKCVVEYLVCSQISGSKPSPVLGAICIDCPGSVLVVLFLDKIISLRITSWFISPHINGESYGKSGSKEALIDISKSPLFQESVQKILKPDNKSTPVFKISDPTNPTPQQSLELLARASSYFRETVFPRHEQTAQLIRTKVRVLVKTKERQLEDLKELMQMRTLVHDKAGLLAEKYDDIYEKQIELSKRAEQVLLAVKTKDKKLSKSEKDMLDNLTVIQKIVDKLKSEIDGVRLNHNTQDQIFSSQNKKKLNELYLSDNQFKAINNNLAVMNADINKLAKQIQEAESELDFDISFNKRFSNN